MGGAWKIMVKLTKHTLKTVTNDSPMYEEVLRTFLIEVESTLNSLPLTSIRDDYNDLQVLTPNDFLTSKLTKYFSSNEFPRSDINSRKRWKSVLALANMFWTRVLRLFTNTSREKKKWNKFTRNFVINDIALVKNENIRRPFGLFWHYRHKMMGLSDRAKLNLVIKY